LKGTPLLLTLLLLPKLSLRPYLPLFTCSLLLLTHYKQSKSQYKKANQSIIMLTVAAAVNAVAAAAEVLVESLVIAAFLFVLCALVVVVFRVMVVAVPSALSTVIAAASSFASSQDDDDGTPTGCGGNMKHKDGADVDEFEMEEKKPEVIELLDDEEVDDEEEVSSVEEDEEVILVETFCANKTMPTTEGPRRRTKKKAVSFGSVQVQEYSVTIGDHPLGGEEGFPISLDWAHTAPTEYTLDRYEMTKPKVRCTCPFLTPEQRLLRIAAVAGICMEDVHRQERTRLWRVEAEALASRPVVLQRAPTASQQ
jgi:hypothetical protein